MKSTAHSIGLEVWGGLMNEERWQPGRRMRAGLGKDTSRFSPKENLSNTTGCCLEMGGAAVFVDRNHSTPGRGARALPGFLLP